MTQTFLKIEPLSAAAFALYGEVIDARASKPILINQGYAQRLALQAHIDVAQQSGEVTLALFKAQPRPNPIAIELMERHPLGSQLFYPLQDCPWLIVVCDDPKDPQTYRAFSALGCQGVNYARNVWHHPLLVLDPNSEFMIIDRKGEGANLEEVILSQPLFVQLS